MENEGLTPGILLGEANENFNRVKMEFLEIWNAKKETSVYGFVEGYDSPYYKPRIVSHSLLETNIINCGGKKNVVKMHHFLSTTSQYRGFIYLFFVDKDYDDNSLLSDEIYITEGYSVENYYLHTTTIQDFVKSFCHIEGEDYRIVIEPVLNDFSSWTSTFMIVAKPFCAWYKCVKNDGCSNAKEIGKSIPEKYIVIHKNGLTSHKCELSGLNNDYGTKPCVTEDSFNAKMETIQSINDIRGKFLMPMLDSFLRFMVDKFNNGKYPIKNKVKFPNRQDQLLSDLSAYAYTPNKLKEYIKKRVS